MPDCCIWKFQNVIVRSILFNYLENHEIHRESALNKNISFSLELLLKTFFSPISIWRCTLLHYSYRVNKIWNGGLQHCMSDRTKDTQPHGNKNSHRDVLCPPACISEESTVTFYSILEAIWRKNWMSFVSVWMESRLMSMFRNCKILTSLLYSYNWLKLAKQQLQKYISVCCTWRRLQQPVLVNVLH
jgi:hypothetical protein